MGCFLDDLRAFGINADEWTTAAQDEGEWRRTAEQGAEHPPERDGKDQGEGSPKQAGSCWFARPC